MAYNDKKAADRWAHGKPQKVKKGEGVIYTPTEIQWMKERHALDMAKKEQERKEANQQAMRKAEMERATAELTKNVEELGIF